MKICLTGGSGFIGKQLSRSLVMAGDEVFVIGKSQQKINSRINFVKADLLKDDLSEILIHCDAIIHLAGVNIFKRWTKEFKKLILASRVQTANNIFEQVKKLPKKPKVFVSASAVGYYGDRGEDILTEEEPPGNDFLAKVCFEWEKAAKRFEKLGIRSVSIRTAPVLGKGGGILSKIIPIFKLGLGGNLGNGKQWFPWIHMEDLVSIYIQAVKDERFSGPINAVSPGIVRYQDFARALAKVLKRPYWFHLPPFFLKLIFGELGEALLASQRVVPQRLQDLGFEFKFPEIDKALDDILKDKNLQ